MRTMLSFALALLIVTMASPCFAAKGVHGGTSGYEWISKGTFDIGLDNILLYRSHSAPDPSNEDYSTSSSNILYIGGLSPKYFVIKNLAVGANLFGFVERQSDTVETATTDEYTAMTLGFMGMVFVDYYLRLGFDFFLKPELGGGYFMGSKRVPGVTDPNIEIKSSISGPMAKVGLGLVYYASAHFNLKASIDLLMRFGTESMEDVELDTSFTEMNAGFTVGLGYTF